MIKNMNHLNLKEPLYVSFEHYLFPVIKLFNDNKNPYFPYIAEYYDGIYCQPMAVRFNTVGEIYEQPERKVVNGKENFNHSLSTKDYYLIKNYETIVPCDIISFNSIDYNFPILVEAEDRLLHFSRQGVCGDDDCYDLLNKNEVFVKKFFDGYQIIIFEKVNTFIPSTEVDLLKTGLLYNSYCCLPLSEKRVKIILEDGFKTIIIDNSIIIKKLSYSNCQELLRKLS